MTTPMKKLVSVEMANESTPVFTICSNTCRARNGGTAIQNSVRKNSVNVPPAYCTLSNAPFPTDWTNALISEFELPFDPHELLSLPQREFHRILRLEAVFEADFHLILLAALAGHVRDLLLGVRALKMDAGVVSERALHEEIG